MKNLLLLILIVFLTSCSVRPDDRVVSTPTIMPAPPSLALTATTAPSDTPLQPPAQPTIPPVEGTTSTQLNVRSDPSTTGSVLGMIPPGTILGIVGKDPGGNWWQILYPRGPEGKGWVTAQYVTVADASAVPVIGGTSGTGPNAGNIAIAQQQINIRSGPGTGFNSLGTLNPQDVVNLTGKDANSTWLQIEYLPGPEGKGWVNAGFVRAQGVENLPIITEAGQVIGTGTPTTIPATPTPTIVPAPVDNDSAGNPIVSVTFAPSGPYTLIYHGDVSAPAGDTEDWIRFVPFRRQVLLEISCSGSGLNVEVMQGSQSLFIQGKCGSRQIIDVEPDVAVEIHAQAAVDIQQTYSSYTIKVKTIP